MTEFIFDTLYGRDSANKIKEWNIKVVNKGDHSIMVYSYGQLGGKKVECTQMISSGKNVGKKNETSHYQQAFLEAQSKWNKKKDIDGYNTNMSSTISKDDTTTPVLPMLAQDYNKHKKKVESWFRQSAVMVQPKFDGYRMIYNTNTGEMTTRQGKAYTIIKEADKLFAELNNLPKGYILDGELYTSNVSFETLGVLRKTKGLTAKDKENLAKIEYHVYDLIDETQPFHHRNKMIQGMFSVQRHPIVYAPTFSVDSEEEINKYHKMFTEQGYEGTMVRNKSSMYKCKFRSTDLLKYKDFQDAEFKIVDFTSEKNTSGDLEEELIVWIVELNNGGRCKVRPQGVKEERQELYQKCLGNFSQFKGRKLWTKFFDYTTDGSLRFPTTARSTVHEYIRDTTM